MRKELCAIVLVLTGCNSTPSPGTDPAKSTSASAPGATSPASAASTEQAPSAEPPASNQAPIASASASSSASADGPSPEPELAEWGKVRETVVKGSGALGCETKMVREWLRIMCVERDVGIPEKITIKKGRKSGERSRGENLSQRNNIITLVIPIAEATDFEAEFAWSSGSHTFIAKRAQGAPLSDRVLAFDPDAPPAGDPPAAP